MNAGALPRLSMKDGKGVMVMVAVPCCPAVSVLDGDMLETVTESDGAALGTRWSAKRLGRSNPRCVESPE